MKKQYLLNYIVELEARINSLEARLSKVEYVPLTPKWKVIPGPTCLHEFPMHYAGDSVACLKCGFSYAETYKITFTGSK